jgi:hypothetical protein
MYLIISSESAQGEPSENLITFGFDYVPADERRCGKTDAKYGFRGSSTVPDTYRGASLSKRASDRFFEQHIYAISMGRS